MKVEKSLNVIFTLDKKFIPHFTVTLTSLLENNKDLKITVYVVHDLEDIKILENILIFFSEKYLVQLNLIQVDNKIFENFMISHHLSKATYFRLLFADIIPISVLSGLYLDCDIIVTGSLNNLVDFSFFNEKNNEEYSLLAVSDKNEVDGIERLNKMGLNTQMYFNAGVLLINFKKWRAKKVSGDLIKTADDYKDYLLWHDQDVLNIFFRNQTGKLNSTYNKFIDRKLPEMPLIIHFSGSSKPWQFFNNNPYKSIYWKYLKLTPFKNEKFEEITIKMVIKKYVEQFKKLVEVNSQ